MSDQSTLYLHIGTHKTVTSAIQYVLRNNNEILRKHDLAYLKLSKKKIRSLTKYNPSLVNSFREKILNECNRYNEQGEFSFIISDEALSGNTDCYYRNIDVIAKSFQDITKGFLVKIIVYLRRQDQFIQSAYTQKIHQGESYSFKEFLNSFPTDALNWKNLLDIYAEYFGKDNIIARVYDDQLLLDDRGILYDFGRIINCEELAVSKQVKFKNKGYSRDSVELARLINPKLNDQQVRFLRSILQSIDTKQPFERYTYFTEKERLAFLQQYAESNSTVAKHYFKKADGNLFSVKADHNSPQKYDGFNLDKCINLFAKSIKYQANLQDKDQGKSNDSSKNKTFKLFTTIKNRLMA